VVMAKGSHHGEGRMQHAAPVESESAKAEG